MTFITRKKIGNILYGSMSNLNTSNPIQIVTTPEHRTNGEEFVLVKDVPNCKIILDQSSTEHIVIKALTKVLIEAGVTTDQQIYKAILKVEEEQDRREVEVLLSHGIVEASETVSETSIVVVSQEIEGDEASKLDYRLYKLMDGSAPEAFVKDVLGRKVGETLIVAMTDDRKLTLVLKEVYSLKPVEA